ncbi:hypothetical protein N2382_11860 [SAR92 clade bacterium H921]|nr:hypothetical protein [SAR92 clade bacterium H921]
MQSISLTDEAKAALFRSVPHQLSQARRLIEHLAQYPDSVTSDVAKKCAIGNISDVARKVNPTLFEHGLFISCRRPVMPIKNRFGEMSNMFLWGIYRLPPEPQNALGLENRTQNS